MTTYKRTLLILFILFFLTDVAWLHRVPGLMGDEASEGQNVYELLEREEITLMGERSYIGPLIDYVRVPFVWVFGYTALAVRVPMFLASLLTFVLAASVLRRWFGDEVSLFPLILMTFSLPYLTHQRLGWAISLFPFFFFLILWFVQREWKYKWLLVGLAAGLGLHTHIMFLPTLAGLVVSGSAWVALRNWKIEMKNLGARRLFSIFLNFFFSIVIGFWAGFATQFVVLQMNPEDQGDPMAVGEVWTERLADLPQLLPVILSGSSYVAHYTGVEFTPLWAAVLMWLVLILALLGLVLSWRKRVVWYWLAGLAVHSLILLYMIDRFSLRYFLMFVLGVYVLAGIGVGEVFVRIEERLRLAAWYVPAKAMGMALILAGFWIVAVSMPFLRAGGSLADFSLGNRTDSASALVDERGLIECLRGVGPVSSENVHIYNRLLYVSHEYSDLNVIPEEEAASAPALIHYRRGEALALAATDELCPGLPHFVVEKNE